MDRVISVRGVGCRKGYPYYAAGLYERTPRANGKGHYWRLVSEASGWHRTHRACLTHLWGTMSQYPVRHARHGMDA